MENYLCAFHGILVVDQYRKGRIVDGNVELQIDDLEFLSFVEREAPFHYEIEGSRPTPPIFEFRTTIIATRKEVEGGAIKEVLYSASTNTEPLGFEWNEWVCFEFHKSLVRPSSEFYLLAEPQFGGVGKKRGLLAYRDEFDGRTDAVFFENELTGEPRLVARCSESVSREVVAFILLNDRTSARSASDMENERNILAKRLFDSLDLDEARVATTGVQANEFNRYGYSLVEIDVETDGNDDAKQRVSDIVIWQDKYLLRGQFHKPSSITNFLESNRLEAPERKIPYVSGGYGQFRLLLSN